MTDLELGPLFNQAEECQKEGKLVLAAPEAILFFREAVEALAFYADPDTYFAIAFLPDPPCGDFAEDFEELEGEWGHPDGGTWVKPGKRARETLRPITDGRIKWSTEEEDS